MNIFSKRPLFLSCTVFLACSVIGYFIPGIAKIILIALAAVSLIFSLILALIKHHSSEKKYSFLCFILITVMIILSFASSYMQFDYELAKRKVTYEKEYVVDAFVLEVKGQSNFASNYVISVNNLSGEKDTHKAVLECSFAAALQVGDKISIIATAESPDHSSGKYNELLELYSENIHVVYRATKEDSLTVHEYSGSSNQVFSFNAISKNLSNIIRQKIGGDAGDLSSALLLGNKHLLAPVIKRDFQRAGGSHILALSGMHMSIIMGFAMFIMKRITRKNWLIAIILSVFAVTYLAITGFSVSATRSVIMLLIVYFSMLISALPDSLTSLSIAGFLIILFSPGAVLDAAFWMSFAATLGILVYIPPINDYFGEKISKYDNNKFKKICCKIGASLTVAVATSLAAIIPFIIVMCIFIKEMSLCSVLTSVVLAIPTEIMIIGSALLLIFQSIPTISGIIISVLRLTSNFMIDFCADISELEGIVFSLNYSFATVVALLLGAALLYSFAFKHKNPFVSLLPFTLCLCLSLGTMAVYEETNKDNLKVSYIHASSNSDIIVLSNQGKGIICDVSNGSASTYYLALDEIYEARVTEIKAIMLTRYTNQHDATLFSICQSYRIRQFWLPTPTNESDYDKLFRIYVFAQKYGVDVYLYEQSESLYAFGNATIEHTYDYIERSAVPVSLIGIFTGREHMTYASPAFNESEIDELAQYHFSKSQYVIFGCRGPKTKAEYTIDNIDKVKSVAFADDIRAAHFITPEFSFTSYYMVPGEIEYYLDK